jgi:hypothetical protein
MRFSPQGESSSSFVRDTTPSGEHRYVHEEKYQLPEPVELEKHPYQHMREGLSYFTQDMSSSTRQKHMQLERPPEKRREAARKAKETLGEDGRREAARKGRETLGEDGRREAARKSRETLGEDGRSEAARKGRETLGEDGRREATRKAKETLGEYGRSEAARKGRETKQANRMFDEYIDMGDNER